MQCIDNEMLNNLLVCVRIDVRFHGQRFMGTLPRTAIKQASKNLASKR